MNVHDEMSDTEVLRAASDSLSGIPVASPPDVAAIMARGRARRRAGSPPSRACRWPAPPRVPHWHSA